jgi:hypothetical protein
MYNCSHRKRRRKNLRTKTELRTDLESIAITHPRMDFKKLLAESNSDPINYVRNLVLSIEPAILILRINKNERA